MKLSAPSRCSGTQGFLSFYLNVIVVSWPSSLFTKGITIILRFFLAKLDSPRPQQATVVPPYLRKIFQAAFHNQRLGIPERFSPDCLLLGYSGLSPFCAEKDSEMTDMSM